MLILTTILSLFVNISLSDNHIFADQSKQNEFIRCASNEDCTIQCNSNTFMEPCKGMTFLAATGHTLTVDCIGDGTSCRDIEVRASDASQLTINVHTISDYKAHNMDGAVIVAPNNGASGYNNPISTTINCGIGPVPANGFTACGYNMEIRAAEGWNDVIMTRGGTDPSSNSDVFTTENGTSLVMNCGPEYKNGDFIGPGCPRAVRDQSNPKNMIGDPPECLCNQYLLPSTTAPTTSPSTSPTVRPTNFPSIPPTLTPTKSSSIPTIVTRFPSVIPTQEPTRYPTMPPTKSEVDEFKIFNGFFFGATDFNVIVFGGTGIGVIIIVFFICLIYFCCCHHNTKTKKKNGMVITHLPPGSPNSAKETGTNTKVGEIEMQKKKVKGATEYDINEDPEIKKVDIENEYKSRPYKSIFDTDKTYKDANRESINESKKHKIIKSNSNNNINTNNDNDNSDASTDIEDYVKKHVQEISPKQFMSNYQSQNKNNIGNFPVQMQQNEFNTNVNDGEIGYNEQQYQQHQHPYNNNSNNWVNPGQYWYNGMNPQQQQQMYPQYQPQYQQQFQPQYHPQMQYNQNSNVSHTHSNHYNNYNNNSSQFNINTIGGSQLSMNNQNSNNNINHNNNQNNNIQRNTNMEHNNSYYD